MKQSDNQAQDETLMHDVRKPAIETALRTVENECDTGPANAWLWEYDEDDRRRGHILWTSSSKGCADDCCHHFEVRSSPGRGSGLFCVRACGHGSKIRFWGREGFVHISDVELLEEETDRHYAVTSRKGTWVRFADRAVDDLCLAFMINEASPEEGESTNAELCNDEQGLLVHINCELEVDQEVLVNYGPDYVRDHYPPSRRAALEGSALKTPLQWFRGTAHRCFVLIEVYIVVVYILPSMTSLMFSEPFFM